MSGKKKAQLCFLFAVLACCVAVFVYLSATLILDRRELSQGEDFFDEITIEFIPRPAVVIQPTPRPTAPSAADNGDNGDNGDEQDNDYAYNDSEEIYVAPTPAPTPFVPVVDFDAKRETMPSIIGWIQSEGTVINYPIVQGNDNLFYLNHLPDGTRNAMGSIFMCYEDEADFSNPNIRIYGHNMRSGRKFASLRRYQTIGQTYFDEHSTMFIFTPTANYLLEIFAGYNVDSSVEQPPRYFNDQEHFERFVADMIRRSFFSSGVTPEYGDQLIFLVTCQTGGADPRRTIIGARMILLDW